MKQELQEKLFKDFYPMFEDRNLSMKETCMYWGIDVSGDGWFDLIYQLCEGVKKIAPSDFRFSQVKEKYGRLCLYTNYSIPAIDDIIEEAEEKSLTICEECGQSGKLIESSTHWFRTRCDKCWEKEPRK